jgi:hypothetical protein
MMPLFKNRQPLPAAAGTRLPRWRRITVWVLLILATVVLVLGALTVWVKRQALETDSWVNTSSALLEDDEIRGALAVYLVDELYTDVDVTAALEQRLPENAKGLAAPLSGALRQLAVQAADQILQRPAAQTLWEEANRTMHEHLIAVIEGNETRVSVEGEDVVLDLRPFLGQLEEQFGITTKLPPGAGRIVIMQADQLKTIQTAAKLLRALSILVVAAVLVLFALAVFLARGWRRKTLRAIAFSILVGGVILLVVRRLVGDHLVDVLADNATTQAPANHVWLIGTSLLTDIAWNLIGYGLITLAAAWLAGPTRPATWIRRRLAPTFRDQPYLPFVIVGVLYLLLLLWGPTRAQREWLWILVFAALLGLGTEIYRRITVAEPVAGATANPSSAPH